MRPTKKTPETIAKLEYAFSIGASIEEACFHADIGQSTYHDWSASDDKFSDRMKSLRNNPVLKARMNVYDEIQKGDVNTSKWYLERKRSHEFSTQQDLSAGDNAGLKIEFVVDEDQAD